MQDASLMLVIDNQIFINEILRGVFIHSIRHNNVNFAGILSKGSTNNQIFP